MTPSMELISAARHGDSEEVARLCQTLTREENNSQEEYSGNSALHMGKF